MAFIDQAAIDNIKMFFYHQQVYPGERHSLRHLDASEHYETNLISFLEQHL